MRKLLILLIALLLLVSCKREDKVLILSSEAGSEVFLIGKEKGVSLSFSEEFQNHLALLGNMSVSDMLKDLFPESMHHADIDGSDYLERARIIYLLNEATDAENTLESVSENRKVLKDSKMLKELDRLSDGFDSVLVECMEKKSDRYMRYYVSKVLRGEYDYKEAKSFLLDWIDSIKR